MLRKIVAKHWGALRSIRLMLRIASQSVCEVFIGGFWAWYKLNSLSLSLSLSLIYKYFATSQRVCACICMRPKKRVHGETCEVCEVFARRRKMGRFLKALTKRGISAKVVGGELKLSPKNLVTDAILKTISDNLTEVLAELQPQPKSLTQQVMDTFGGVLSSDTSDYPWANESADPRPDLPADHDAWERLLSLSADIPIYPTLHYFRCCGAHLRRSCNQWGLWRGEMDEVEYTRVRRTLQPTDDIIARTKNPLTIQLGRL